MQLAKSGAGGALLLIADGEKKLNSVGWAMKYITFIAAFQMTIPKVYIRGKVATITLG